MVKSAPGVLTPAGGLAAAGDLGLGAEERETVLLVVLDDLGDDAGVGVLAAQPQESPLDRQVVAAVELAEVLRRVEGLGLGGCLALAVPGGLRLLGLFRGAFLRVV